MISITSRLTLTILVAVLMVHHNKAQPEWHLDNVGSNEERSRMALHNFYKSLGQKKYQFDPLDASGLTGFKKRPFDSMDGAQLSGLNKKAFDVLESSKLGGFQKRMFDSFEGGGFTGHWKRYPHTPYFPY